MQKWEYKVVHFSINVQAELNKLGVQGWELVAVDDLHQLYLKRRKS
jgi:hypothetical protein